MMGRKSTLHLHNPDETTDSDGETSSSASTAVSPQTPIDLSNSNSHRSLGRPGTFGQLTNTQFLRRLSDPAASLSNSHQRPALLQNQFEQLQPAPRQRPQPQPQQQQQTDSSGVPISAYGLAPVPFKVWLQDRKGRLDKINKKSSNLDTSLDDSGSNFESNYEDEAEDTVSPTLVNTSSRTNGLPSPVSPSSRRENLNPRFYELPGATVTGIPPYPSLTKRPSNVSSASSSSSSSEEDDRRQSRHSTSTPSSTRSFSVPPPTPPVRSASRKRDMQNDVKVVRFATFGRGEARERMKEKEEERRGKVVLKKEEFVELIKALRDDTRVNGEQRDAAPARKESLKRTKDKDVVGFFD
ncbi:hypothetical protein BJ742DRAFT_143202 [Cladochytrium replicatum]|nr:hypothetical protein BJ742DRAFT_143202 [Cladochytrium replicatum]